jgi:hypothetical protein
VEPSLKTELAEAKYVDLCDRFKPGPGWEGPFIWPPEVVAYVQQRQGLTVEPSWYVFVYQPALNSWDPDNPAPGGGNQAAASYRDVDHFLNTPNEVIAKRLTLAIAGRAAHEALEWATLDGERLIEPHGSSEELAEVAAEIRTYLQNAAQEDLGSPS